jgi:hypothetical protein
MAEQDKRVRHGGRRQWLRRATAAGAVAVSAAVLTGAGVGVAGAAGNSSGALVNQAKPHLIKLSDFPAGWVASGTITKTSGSSTPGSKQLAQCLGVSQNIVNLNAPGVNSQTFSNKTQSLLAQDNFGFFPSTKIANEEYAVFSSSKAPACLTTLFSGPLKQSIAAGFGSGATIGNVTVTELPSAAIVPHTAGFTIAFPVTANGQNYNVALNVVTMVRGKLGSQVIFTSIGAPFSNSLIHHVVSVAYNRT